MTDTNLRNNGPFDESEASFGDENRVDLGGLLLSVPTGVELQVQADQASGRITALTLRHGESGMQLQPYAARKSGGMWEEVIASITTSVNSSGGLIEQVEGPWGVELNAQIKANESAGTGSALQPARFVGIDGPRWFLRAVFLGKAARDRDAAQVLSECLRTAVVIRGDSAMAPGAPLALRIPKDSMSPEQSELKPPSPFERGPEITEIR